MRNFYDHFTYCELNSWCEQIRIRIWSTWSINLERLCNDVFRIKSLEVTGRRLLDGNYTNYINYYIIDMNFEKWISRTWSWNLKPKIWTDVDMRNESSFRRYIFIILYGRVTYIYKYTTSIVATCQTSMTLH